MEFEQFRGEAAGIAYSPALDDKLWALYQAGVQPHDVPTRITD